MTRRTLKKIVKRRMDWLTREKIPAAFKDEAERKRWVSAYARRAVGQKFCFPEGVEK